ncbi:MAG: YciI family protein [Ignavibacteriae bacterium]|nr:YciI family protein [Ignavibacteriota bacterium]
MKYLFLVYGEERRIGAMTDDECMKYDHALRQGGKCLASEALQSIQTATTIRVRNGKVSITDGPFAETKEQLAGFYLVDAEDLSEAVEIAAKIPPAQVGSIEIRPIRELLSTKGEKRYI